jgi:hypothetical protein
VAWSRLTHKQKAEFVVWAGFAPGADEVDQETPADEP